MRRITSIAVVALVAACGGVSPSTDPTAPGAPGVPPSSAPGSLAGAPGTPAPAAPSSNPLPTVGSGSNRFEMGAASGLYLVDPAAGEPTVQGFVVVNLGPVGGVSNLPADIVVTMNGVPLLRDPNLNGSFFRVDPAGPQPSIGSGGQMVLVASATDPTSGKPIQRTLVLPCPSDIPVVATPSPGSTLTEADVHVVSTSDVNFNAGVPLMAQTFPQATLFGYDPATRSLLPSGSPKNIVPGPIDVTVAVTPTAAPAYLFDLRWPGQFILDGQTGGFCGLAKRWTYAK